MAIDNPPPEEENKNHRYLGSDIPWYVHVMWVIFWLFAITYTLVYLLPKLQPEILSPP
jgi:hypothetical protein